MQNPTVPAQPAAYYPALDGLRALAIVLVFLAHFNGSSPIWGWGWIGVDLFFVLSGFLITGILFDSRGRIHAFRDFYVRRTLRIFPLYFFIWGLILLTQPLLHWTWAKYSELFPLYLGNFAMMMPQGRGPEVDLFYFHLHGRPSVPLRVGHFWSLCIEEQFYLMWPVVVLKVRSRAALLKLTAAVLVAVALLRLALLFLVSAELRHGTHLFYLSTFTRVDALLWGALLAILVRGTRESLHRYGRPMLAIAVVLFAIYVGTRSVLAAPGTAGSTLSDWNMVLGLPLIDVLGFVLILELIRAGSPLAKLASWPPGRRLGQISYGFYVFHFLLVEVYTALVHRLLPARLLVHPVVTVWVTDAVAFAVTLFLAMISFRYLETPFIQMKSYFTAQTHTAPTT